ncbi:actin depolymerizing protein [Mollisia scopiformis]|uniref:Actin depolymerizing protein n=1 Tax=Mollisia scopiformis TaxID=149040 RepID=A0A194X233_MOLSC|nr:actin depolymerizing protein [Mollisia scopiformis]KUJ14238.1 actin depolymerizing protein [Mollisia scopiformis]
MAPHEGLTHLKQYDIKDSNVELIGTEIDHKVKYKSAETEPAWKGLGQHAGLYIWRIEDFEVVPWPKEKYGQFYDGDSYIVLHSYKIGDKNGQEQLGHEIFFWLGQNTSQDEAGTAAYKTVELDEFLRGVATQHREIQQQPSDEIMHLFPRLRILSGGVKSGFRHVEAAEPEEKSMLLRIFKHPGTGSTVVHEVQPIWQSLDDDDVFVLDKGDKIWVWQGSKCSPMEKAKGAQVVSDLTLAKHIDVEVLSQTEARSRVIVDLLGGKNIEQREFRAPRPVSSTSQSTSSRPQRLFCLSDASGQLSFNLVKEGQPVQSTDFQTNDVFLFDTGKAIWVWKGLGASRSERAMWMKVAQSYLRQLQSGPGGDDAHLTPLATVSEGSESPAFLKVIDVR